MVPRYIPLILTLLALAAPALATVPPRPRAEPGLVIEGETTVVVTKLPFDVVAPTADFHNWRIPAGWETSGEESRLTVTKATGVGVVSCTTISFLKNKEGTFDKVKSTYAITVTVGKVPDTKPPPIIPPPGSALYFMAIRADGAASPTFTQIMSDPAWETLKGKGHLVKDFTATRARELGYTVGAVLPCVLTLRVTGDKSAVVRQSIPLPLTSDGILRLEVLP